MSHFGPPDSIRRRVGRLLSRGGPDPDFPASQTCRDDPDFPASQTCRKGIYQSHRGREWRPLLHETLLLGPRNALHTTAHAETQTIAFWRPRPGDPLTISHFGPPDSIRRRVGRPLSRGGGLAQIFRAGQTGRKAIYQAGWPSPQGQGGEAAFARNASARL